MNVSRRAEILLGLVFPLLVVVALSLVAMNTGEPGTSIAFMASAPMFAAMFTRAVLAGVVALATVLVAAVTAAVTFGQSFYDALPVMVGVIIGAGIAVLASQAKSVRPQASVAIGSAVPGAAVAATGEPSDTDGLTGLPTRHALHVLVGAMRSDRPRSVVLMDCDRLGAVNEERGREIGDVFIFAAAGRTRYALPETDVLARWGDDELLAVIEGDIVSARPLLDLITDKINQNPIRTDAGLVPLTVSVGAAQWDVGSGFDEALEAARRGLYRAKSDGGARLVIEVPSGPCLKSFDGWPS